MVSWERWNTGTFYYFIECNAFIQYIMFARHLYWVKLDHWSDLWRQVNSSPSVISFMAGVLFASLVHLLDGCIIKFLLTEQVTWSDLIIFAPSQALTLGKQPFLPSNVLFSSFSFFIRLFLPSSSPSSHISFSSSIKVSLPVSSSDLRRVN